MENKKANNVEKFLNNLSPIIGELYTNEKHFTAKMKEYLDNLIEIGFLKSYNNYTTSITIYFSEKLITELKKLPSWEFCDSFNIPPDKKIETDKKMLNYLHYFGNKEIKATFKNNLEFWRIEYEKKLIDVELNQTPLPLVNKKTKKL
jgi:hypothetical protein